MSLLKPRRGSKLRETTPMPPLNSSLSVDAIRSTRSNRGLVHLPTPAPTTRKPAVQSDEVNKSNRKRSRTPVMMMEEVVPASESEPDYSPLARLSKKPKTDEWDADDLKKNASKDWTPESPRVARRRQPHRRTSLLRREWKDDGSPQPSEEHGLHRYPTRRRPACPGVAPLDDNVSPPTPTPLRKKRVSTPSMGEESSHRNAKFTPAAIILSDLPATPPMDEDWVAAPSPPRNLPKSKAKGKSKPIAVDVTEKQDQHKIRYLALLELEKEMFPIVKLKVPYAASINRPVVKPKPIGGKGNLPDDAAMKSINSIIASLSRQFDLNPIIPYCTMYHLLRVFTNKQVKCADFAATTSYSDEFGAADDFDRCMAAAGCFWVASKTIEDTEDIHSPELRKALNTALQNLSMDDGSDWPDIQQRDLNSAERMVYDRLAWSIGAVNLVNPWSMLQELIGYVRLEPLPDGLDDANASTKQKETLALLDLPEEDIIQAKLYQKAEAWLSWMIHGMYEIDELIYRLEECQ
jgi:hypothetical protein